MLRMKITIVVFYCVSQLYCIYAVIKFQQKQLDFPGKELIFGHESFKDGKLTYAVCTNNDTSNEKTCNVIREKAPLSNDTLNCNVTLKILAKNSNGTDVEIDDQFGLVPFGKDKAVLYFIQKNKRTKTRLNTIQFDGCKVVEKNITVSNFVFSKYNIVIIPYSNSYDVVYPTTLRGFKKMTIDLNGERINGPIGLGYYLWLAHFPYILPVSQRSRSKGFVYLSFDDYSLDEYDLNLWKPSGSEKILGKHKIVLRSIKSIDYGFISICHDVNNTYYIVKCTQYDVNGKAKFVTDLIGHENQSIAFVHNVPGGGLFLFGGKPKNDTENIDFFLVKLDSSGMSNGSLSIGEIEFKAEALVTTFYKNGDSEYCISVADYNAIGVNSENSSIPYYIDQTVTCFNDSDFSV